MSIAFCYHARLHRDQRRLAYFSLFKLSIFDYSQFRKHVCDAWKEMQVTASLSAHNLPLTCVLALNLPLT